MISDELLASACERRSLALSGSINSCYDKAGMNYVKMLTQIFYSYSGDSALEGVDLKAAMVLPALLLQKPHSQSKAKEKAAHLE